MEPLFEFARSRSVNITDSQVRFWEGKLARFRPEEVRAAVDRLMLRKELRKMFIWPELLELLPAGRIQEAPKPPLAWWHADGSWGGDWSRVRDLEELTGYCVSMLQMAECPSGQINRVRREEFFAMARRRGVDWDAVVAKAAVVPYWLERLPKTHLNAGTGGRRG
jgi:hypothetical protein